MTLYGRDAADRLLAIATNATKIVETESAHLAQLAETIIDLYDRMDAPPRIIRTLEELATLDPDTVLGVWHPDLDMGCILMPAREWADDPSVTPLAVIATGDHVRAARQALKEAE